MKVQVNRIRVMVATMFAKVCVATISDGVVASMIRTGSKDGDSWMVL